MHKGEDCRTTRRRRWAWGAIAGAALALTCAEQGARPPPADVGADARRALCLPDNGSLTLPEGFCATVFADALGRARHLAVTPSGDVFVAVRGSNGGVVALRDANGDGVAEQQERFSDTGGNGVAWRDGWLYFAQDDRILRYRLPDGQLTPTGAPELVVRGLPAREGHTTKTIVFDPRGRLWVNIGSETNSCQVEDREPHSPGMDPCPELAERAGVWRFDAEATDQTQSDGVRYATGLRNMVALALEPSTGALYGAQNGRDQLHEHWPELYSEADDLRLPSEELLRIEEGGDYGWPYCYHDASLGQKVLAPEYGGDGREVGRCASVGEPELAFPAHWAPLSLHFYTGAQFPQRYHQGAFVAFHGSRFEPQAEGEPGYQVAFAPFLDGRPAGTWETFAGGFAGPGRPLPDRARHRPVGLAQGPDGSLYVSDDKGGRIWRIFYVGP